MRTGKNTAGGMILDLLFPPRCPFCGGIPGRGEGFHAACAASLPRIRTRRCLMCGKPVEDWERLCPDCRDGGRSFDAGFGVWLYEEPLKDALAALKYRGRREYGAVIGRLMAEAAAEAVGKWRPDAVAPVPVHQERLRRRGYNQAEELARPVALRFGLPLADSLLLRTGRTEAMKELGREARRRNLEGAFRVRTGEPVPRRVLIVDDIFTTGATAEACAAALKEAGAERVFFLAAATGGGALSRY